MAHMRYAMVNMSSYVKDVKHVVNALRLATLVPFFWLERG